MKDERGLFYYPYPANKKVRMYVRRENDTISFRLWNQNDIKLWQDHGWVEHEAVQQAAKLYAGKEFKPNEAYDITIATRLLEEDENP